MDRPLNISFAGYRIVRTDHPADQPGGPAKYTVYRPDGSVCCDGKDWPEVERIIHGDEAARPGTSPPSPRAAP